MKQLAGLVEWKDLGLQTMSRMVEEGSHLWDELSKIMVDKDELLNEIKVVLALGTEISELKSTNGSLVGFHPEVNPRV